MPQLFDIVVAVDEKSGIGKSGSLPWHLPADLKHFKEVTSRPNSSGQPNAVIMGRKTWESIPEKFQPLPGRQNIVLTRQLQYELPKDVLRAQGLDEALQAVQGAEIGIFIIGGAEVFAQALGHPGCRKIYLTRIRKDFQCDVFFPQDLSLYRKVSESVLQQEEGLSFVFVEYERLLFPSGA